MFCPKCQSLMMPQEGFYVCTNCGHKVKIKSGSENKIEYQAKESEVMLITENSTNLPTTRIECPECGNKKAYWRLEQTRAADEPPTRIYRCTKCNHTWREY